MTAGKTPETTNCKTLNAALLASARGDWDTAGTLLRGLVEQDEENYAVRLVSLVAVEWGRSTAKAGAYANLFFPVAGR